MNVKSYFLDLGGSNLDAGAHGAGDGAASDILALYAPFSPFRFLFSDFLEKNMPFYFVHF